MVSQRRSRRIGLRTALSFIALALVVVPAHAVGARPLPRPVHAGITIVLAGPNQWTTSPTTFGKAWEAQVKRFEAANSGVTLKTNVLPLTSFFQTESTLIQAGSGPDLMFNQLTYKPVQVINLNPYLNQPNPYALGDPKYKNWLDWFPAHSLGKQYQDVNGHWDWVPFNLFDSGVYVNADAFKKAGVALPLKTWQDLVNAVPKLKKAGYIPFAMDGSYLYQWIPDIIFNMLMQKYYHAWDHYLPSGMPGKSGVINIEDWARAIKTGTNIAATPEFAEAMVLTKWFFDNAVTPNWSGIKGLSGIGLDIPDFVAGKTAMAFGADFAYPGMSAAKFKFSSMPFPTITKATTPLSQNLPAQFGASPGGTSYLIPATTKGDNLAYAVKFLQYMTAPKTAQQWIYDSAGAPSVYGEVGVPGIAAFNVGDWGTPMQNGYGLWGGFGPTESTTALGLFTGYLLGAASLADTQTALEAAMVQGITYEIQQSPKTWGKEPWAK